MGRDISDMEYKVLDQTPDIQRLGLVNIVQTRLRTWYKSALRRHHKVHNRTLLPHALGSIIFHVRWPVTKLFAGL